MKKEPRYFTPKQFNKIAFEASHAIVKYRKYMKLIDKQFRSQIMLAVSQVNSCGICSYLHTKNYLKSGATDEELEFLLVGDYNKEEALALLFAQHYAETLGDYDKETLDKVVDHYDKDKTLGILASIKIIMFGNTNGIAITNLGKRLTFRRVKNSKFLTELYNGLLAYLIFPIFLIINLFKKRKPYI